MTAEIVPFKEPRALAGLAVNTLRPSGSAREGGITHAT